MDALRIVLENIRLMDSSLTLNRTALLVAVPTGHRNIERVDGRQSIPCVPHIVASMAVTAARRQWIPPLKSLSMQGRVVLLLLVRMTQAALGGRNRALMGELRAGEV